MTASEPPAKLGADIRGDDDVRCGVQSGGGPGRRRSQEEKRKLGEATREHQSEQMERAIRFRSNKAQPATSRQSDKPRDTVMCSPWAIENKTHAQQKRNQCKGQARRKPSSSAEDKQASRHKQGH